MRNGEGGGWFLLLNSAGAVLKGCAHKLVADPLLPQSIQSQVPSDFSSFLNEPAFSMQYATFCYWRKTNGHSWKKINGSLINDGSNEILSLLVSGPSGYKEWAEDYYECLLSMEAVVPIFNHQPLSNSLILSLNSSADVASVYADATEIAYPCQRA